MNLEERLQKFYIEKLEQNKKEFLDRLRILDFNLSVSRDKSIYKSKDFKTRTIWTPWTDLITFKRRRYYNTETKKYCFLLDQELELDSRVLVSEQHRKLAIHNFSKMRSYQKIADIAFNGRVSKATIHNYIKKAKTKFSMQRYRCNNEGILYINCDGMWIKKNNNTEAYEIKNFVFFTGRHKDATGKRWILEGRTLKHFTYGNDIKKLALKVEQIIHEYDDVREIRVVGDGAAWIKTLAKRIGGIYYIDKFHFNREIIRLVGRDNDKTAAAFNIFKKDIPKDTITRELLYLIADPVTGEIPKEKIKIISFLANNAEYYHRNIMYDNPINTIESMQAHYQGKYFKNQRKGWNKKILNNLINYMNSIENGGEEIDVDIVDIDKPELPLFNNYGISASLPSWNVRLKKWIDNEYK